jgi:hypothetical protein
MTATQQSDFGTGIIHHNIPNRIFVEAIFFEHSYIIPIILLAFFINTY